MDGDPEVETGLFQGAFRRDPALVPQLLPARMALLKQTIDRLLQLLQEHDTTITFFVLSCMYELCPQLVQRIHDRGHEIAFHGHTHRRVADSQVLENELIHARGFLEHFRPKGFRAPFLYLTDASLHLLTRHGFAYDSSTLGPPGHTSVRGEMQLFPVTTVAYRRKDTGLRPYPAHVTPRLLLREFPLGTAIMLSHCRPLYGALLRYYGRRRRPCTFYVHPWQLAPALLPQHFRSLHPLRMLNRFSLFPTVRKLLKRHSFRRMDWLLTATPEAIREQPVHFMTVDLW